MQNTPTPAHENVRRYRQRMQQQGLRLIQMWVPDTRSAAFAEECRRQSRLASQSDNDHDVMDLLEEAAQDIEGWTP